MFRKRPFKTVNSFLVVLILAACSKATDSTDPIVGTWKATCVTVSSDTPYGSMTETIAANNTATMTSIAYSAAGCADSLKNFTVGLTVSWTKGAAVTGVDGAYNLDSTYSKVEFTIHTDALVSQFNTAGACGGGWTKDVAKEITATAASCTGFPKSGDKNYDIYKVDGTKLYFGDSSGGKDGSTADKRPTALKTSLALDKQ